MARAPILAALLLALAAPAVPAAAAGDFGYLHALPAAADGQRVVVDTRPLAECRTRTLAGARCLPADDLFGPQRRLPSARDLLWLLGTAGFAGNETVWVVGHDPEARDFVAGLLHVAGQREVRIVTEPVARALAGGAPAGPGQDRVYRRQAIGVPIGLLVAVQVRSADFPGRDAVLQRFESPGEQGQESGREGLAFHLF